MDSLDPDLDLLRDELERLDYVVVHHGEHICVRLPLLECVAFLGMVGLAHDACRFVLTEGCLTRLQQLIASSGTLSSRSRVPGLDPGQRPALSERAPAPVLDQHVADHLRGVR